jgi:hypothetical protein
MPFPNAHLLARAEWQAARRVAVLWIQGSRTYEVRAGSEYATIAKGDCGDIRETIVIHSAPAEGTIQGFYVPFLPLVIRQSHALVTDVWASLPGLRVASANAKDVHIHSNSLRSIRYASEGIPLTTPERGWDLEEQ